MWVWGKENCLKCQSKQPAVYNSKVLRLPRSVLCSTGTPAEEEMHDIQPLSARDFWGWRSWCRLYRRMAEKQIKSHGPWPHESIFLGRSLAPCAELLGFPNTDGISSLDCPSELLKSNLSSSTPLYPPTFFFFFLIYKVINRFYSSSHNVFFEAGKSAPVTDTQHFTQHPNFLHSVSPPPTPHPPDIPHQDKLKNLHIYLSSISQSPLVSS